MKFLLEKTPKQDALNQAKDTKVSKVKDIKYKKLKNKDIQDKAQKIQKLPKDTTDNSNEEFDFDNPGVTEQDWKQMTEDQRFDFLKNIYTDIHDDYIRSMAKVGDKIFFTDTVIHKIAMTQPEALLNGEEHTRDTIRILAETNNDFARSMIDSSWLLPAKKLSDEMGDPFIIKACAYLSMILPSKTFENFVNTYVKSTKQHSIQELKQAFVSLVKGKPIPSVDSDGSVYTAEDEDEDARAERDEKRKSAEKGELGVNILRQQLFKLSKEKEPEKEIQPSDIKINQNIMYDYIDSILPDSNTMKTLIMKVIKTGQLDDDIEKILEDRYKSNIGREPIDMLNNALIKKLSAIASDSIQGNK